MKKLLIAAFASLSLFTVSLVTVSLGSAVAGEFSLISLQYSAEKFVPHIQFDGPVIPGDLERLQSIINTFVHCQDECFDQDGESAAVLTLNSPGGSYIIGLRMAKLLRAYRIATVVEEGQKCYSACAFAFLGGSGFSTAENVGVYIDRLIEPGGIVGFHAPYYPDKALKTRIEKMGIPNVMNETRESISLMVQQLVNWNVDPSVIAKMTAMGPSETFNLATARDLYLVRSGLPDAPLSEWKIKPVDAIRNACLRMVAQYTSTSIDDASRYVARTFTRNFGIDRFDIPLSGLAISNQPRKGLQYCGVQNFDPNYTGTDYDINLYSGTGLLGKHGVLLSMFNRRKGWSNVGTGGNNTRRIFAKGSLTHYFLPANMPLSEMSSVVGQNMLFNRFFTLYPPALPPVQNGFTVISETKKSRLSAKGNVYIFENTGSPLLFDTAREKLTGKGNKLNNNSTSKIAFVRSGDYTDRTGIFSWVGLRDTKGTLLTRIEVIRNPKDGPVTAAERAQVLRSSCVVKLGDLKLQC